MHQYLDMQVWLVLGALHKRCGYTNALNEALQGYGVTVGGGLEKLSQGRNFFFWSRPELNFLHMLTMSSKLFQPRLSFLHMLIMSSRIDVI